MYSKEKLGRLSNIMSERMIKINHPYLLYTVLFNVSMYLLSVKC